MTFLAKFFLVLIFASSALVLGVLPFLGEPGLANPKTAGILGLWINFIGALHPVFLHLPIGALLLLVTMEFLGTVTRGKVRIDSPWALLFAFGTSLLALLTGYSLYLTGNYSGELIQVHKRDAFLFCWVLLATTAWSLWVSTARKNSLLTRCVYLAGLGCSVVLMTKAGHYGGEITHGDPIDQLPPKILADRQAAAEAQANDPVVFTHIVQPILEVSCVYCHGSDKQAGEFRMDSLAGLLKGGEEGPGLVVGDPDKSAIIQRVHLPLNDDLHMPPSDKPQLSPDDITFLKWWIAQGASETARVSDLKKTPEIDAALENLVSPEQRQAIEEENMRRAKEEAARTIASKASMEPTISEIEAAFPGALKYLATGTDALRFILHSHAASFGAEGMTSLKKLSGHLVEADFTLSGMDPPTLRGIWEWTALKHLNVSQTNADDAFVEAISVLPALESLSLYGTKVTPACAESLAKIKSLRVVYVSGTAFDEPAAAALQKRLTEGRESPVRVVGPSPLPQIVAPTPKPTPPPQPKKTK
jgi:uncharacterized membrane protein